MKAIISNLINIHIDPWKTYCNLIHENSISANEKNKIHQDKIGETNAIQAEQKDLTFKQTKWFFISSELFEQINMQSINRWISISKHIIRSSKRKISNERQHISTKYFTLKPLAKQHSVIRTIPSIKQKNLHQFPIHQQKIKTYFSDCISLEMEQYCFTPKKEHI